MFFESQLAFLGLATTASSLASRWPLFKRGADPTQDGQVPSTLAFDYLLVYCLFMSADWLQGPYMFRLLHDEHHFPLADVAQLFVIGFLSAAVASPIVGRLADLYGRRSLCLVACVLYSIDCLMICLPSWTSCVVARIAGGAATSILWSVPESWLVSTAHTTSLPSSSLSRIFGNAAFLNGVMAVIAGLVSNGLVSYTGTAKAPFRMAVVMLTSTACAILWRWSENKGHNSETSAGGVRGAIKAILRDSNLCAILLAQTIFETSMYNFVFAWVPAMDELASKVGHPSSNNLPLGLIFASFMLAMMLGSLGYGYLSKRAAAAAEYMPVAAAPASEHDVAAASNSAITRHGKLAATLLAVAGTALALANLSSYLELQFWGFCLFEFTVGVYFPVMGWLKSELVHDDVRATVASLFRLPLNIMVTLSLLFGAESHRDLIFQAAAVALAVSAAAIYRLLVQRRLAPDGSGQGPAVYLKM